MISFIIAALAVCLLSFLLTGILRRVALARQVLDIPNHRSSHTVPTPRGGGLAIVVVFTATTLALFFLGQIDAPFFMALGSALLVAGIGFLDDLGHLAVRWRLSGHISAALWALFWLGIPVLELDGTKIQLGWGVYLILTLYLVWMLNLNNFMDGIDGIAGVEAICACGGAAVLYATVGEFQLIVPVLALVLATAGFLVWNFPPAKIFMGDAGSGFLGILFGIFSLQAAHADPLLLWGWLVLLGVFIVDATYTLLRRLSRGEKIYHAHRSHAYQVAARRCGGHFPVTLSVIAINLLWLLPIAWAIVSSRLDAVLGLVLAYAPLVLLAILLGAGAEEKQ